LFEGKYISLSFRHWHNELYFNALQLVSNNWLDCSNMLLVMLNTILFRFPILIWCYVSMCCLCLSLGCASICVELLDQLARLWMSSQTKDISSCTWPYMAIVVCRIVANLLVGLAIWTRVSNKSIT
jgi:hypothetical protein